MAALLAAVGGPPGRCVMVAPAESRPELAEVLERGTIFFGYRPRSAVAAVRGITDIERLYAILSPEAGDRPVLYRVLVIGRKRPPRGTGGAGGPGGAGGAGARYWGMVTRVADAARKIAQELAQEEYMTRAGGRCVRVAARPCGEGAYCIARHGDHTHLGYVLRPAGGAEAEAARRALGIETEGNYLLSIKNPAGVAALGSPEGDEQGATYPERLQDRFADRRFIAAETTEFLDYEGTQVLLVAVGQGATEELGVSLDPAAEARAAAEVIADLRGPRETPTLESLFWGEREG